MATILSEAEARCQARTAIHSPYQGRRLYGPGFLVPIGMIASLFRLRLSDPTAGGPRVLSDFASGRAGPGLPDGSGAAPVGYLLVPIGMILPLLRLQLSDLT